MSVKISQKGGFMPSTDLAVVQLLWDLINQKTGELGKVDFLLSAQYAGRAGSRLFVFAMLCLRTGSSCFDSHASDNGPSPRSCHL